MRTCQLYIDGRSTDAVSGKTFPTVNPATGVVLAQVAYGDSADIALAVEAARRSYVTTWAATEPPERSRLLLRWADLMEAHGDHLAMLDSSEAGRPLLDCKADISAATAVIRFFAGLTDKIGGSTLPVQAGYLAYTRREPYGVIGAIIPWNYPFYNAVVKVAPILAMGNTCVLKPAEQTSLSAVELARLGTEAGFPNGVFNVVTGYGETAGASLVLHMDVDKVTFTGSTDVGRRVMQGAALSNLKPVTLELGGKSPNIVFADCDLDAAIAAQTLSVFYNQGQTCTAATRLLVQRDVAHEVVDRLVDIASRIRVGDPLDESTHVGAIVSDEQHARVMRYIDAGKREGATLRAGGGRPAHLPGSVGLFIEPTVFTDVTPEMSIAREEIFGPVVSVLPFDSEEDAIHLANQVQYGLAASVWTKDVARMHRVAHRVQAGLVWGNCMFVENPAAPVGGYKQSGFGKEYGIEAAIEYTRLKTVWVNIGAEGFAWVE